MSKTLTVSDETYEKIREQIEIGIGRLDADAESTAVTLPVQERKINGLDYVIIRTYSAGVFAGYLKTKNGKEVTLLNARRLWQWYGASSLSQIAMEGVSKPNQCKFPCEVDKILLTEVIEVDYCTEKARQSIAGVSVWKS